MRIKRLLSLFLSAVLSCALLTGCSGMSLTGNDVLTPPRAHGAHARLQALIRERAGNAYTLVYPSSGELQSAVFSRDIDGDGAEEAVAMYRDRDDIIHILSLIRDGSGYDTAGEALLDTPVIERVDFADLDGSGSQELVISYPDSLSGLLSLTVIRLGGSYRRSDMPAACDSYLITEISGSGQDILLFSLPSPFASASAQLLDYADGDLYVKGACEMDSRVESFGITCGSVSRGISGVFVDGINAAGEYTTQVLYYSPDDGLINPLFIYAGYDSTRRPAPVACCDIDGDGLIELPVCSLFEMEEDEDEASVCRRITWNSYDTDGHHLISRRTAVLCGGDGALFTVSDNRVGAVTARTDADGAVNLYTWEYRDGAMRRGDLLLTVRCYGKDSGTYPPITEKPLGETDTAVYTYLIAPGGSRLGYTDSEVADSFILPQTAGDHRSVNNP